MHAIRNYIFQNCVVFAAILGLSGCIEGERMLTKSERIPEIEGGKWCELETKNETLVDNCQSFDWHDGLYHAGDRLFGLKRIGDGKFIGEYVEFDEETGDPKSKYWAKFVVAFDPDNKRMANVGDDEENFLDFVKIASYYAEARDVTLSYDDEFAIWNLFGAPYAMRRFMTDLSDHLDPINKRYYKMIDDADSPGNYPLQIANIANNTTNEAYVGEYICLTGVNRAKADQIVLAEIPAIKKVFDACDAIQGLKLREYAALGGLMWTGGKIPEADTYFRKAIESLVGPGEQALRHETLEKWGVMHFNSENYPEAIRILSILLDEDDGHLNALQFRGLAYRRINDHPNAIADYTATIEIANALNKPLEIAIAYMRRSYVHQLDGRLDDAERDSVIALQLEPKLTYAHSNMGTIAEKRGELAAAKKHFEKALELNKDNTHALDGLKRLK